MVHRPKIETLSEYTAREYGLKDAGSGAVSNKIKKAKQACNLSHIHTKSLTESQLKLVKDWIFNDAFEQDRKEFYSDSTTQNDALTAENKDELNITHNSNSSDTKQISELNITQLDSSIETSNELNITHASNDAPPVESKGELNITQLDTGKKQTSELNITHNSSDKFISINYRREDNTRHTVQIERFYIDALIAIGITDISRFVAENAGDATVTKNVKRSIVNELVKRATNKT